MATTSTSVTSSKLPGGVPKAEPRPIYLRAYAEPEAVVAGGGGGGRDAEPSHYTVIFDCETTPDREQRLRFGSYQVRAGGVLREKGLFYDPDAVDDQELEQLHTARAPGLHLRTLRSFVEDVFFDMGYATDAVIVGFNLPFDISRLAIDHASARTVRRKDGTADRSMVGGFTFKLSEVRGRPNVRVKHLSRRAAFINFAAPSDAEVGEKVNRGFFVDVKTLAAALTSTSFSLSRLAKHLGVQDKGRFEGFDRKIDREFMEYAAQDSETTWLCYSALIDRYDAHNLWKKQPSRIYSEASLGKAYLAAMGVKPLRPKQTYSAVSIGRIMSAYYGGRAEVHRRREVVRTAYCDFASMYPTVCTLMGLWRFVIADGVEEHDATDATRALLSHLSVDQLRDPAFWLRLRVLVEVKPDADIFPVRSRFGEGPSNTIGVNYLSADRTLWFTLADCIASTLLTGKPPEVVSAIRYEPTAVQTGLSAVPLAGTSHVVHAAHDDFYRRVINIRREVKAQEKAAKDRGAPAVEVDRLAAEQLGLKILANATSYGVFIELNVEDADGDGEEVRVHGADAPFAAETTKVERPGRFFHPALATLITGAARLMLAITERRAIDAGLDWAFCDTDSMAFAMPDGMEPVDFMQRVESLREWFTPLNPYDEKGSILELESQNFGGASSKALEPLFCFAVSAKRYALFNSAAGGEIVIRKASAHGLGHLSAPYGEDDPDAPPRASGVRPWQEDVWRAIIIAALEGRPRYVPIDWHADLDTRAASQHTASTPELLRPFRHLNADKLYAEQVRPFGFMLWFHAKRREDSAWTGDGADTFDPRAPEVKAASPYYRDPREVPPDAIFHRDTGEAVPPSALRSYADVLRGYHRSPESKFIGGGAHDIGALARRHVFASAVINIGKEADAFEEAESYGADEDDVTVYGASPLDRDVMRAEITAAAVRALKVRANVGHAIIARARSGGKDLEPRVLFRIYWAAVSLRLEKETSRVEDQELCAWLEIIETDIGLQALSAQLAVDRSNLRKALASKRLGRALAQKARVLRDKHAAASPPQVSSGVASKFQPEFQRPSTVPFHHQ